MLAGELISRLAGELSLSPRQVAGALELFEAGNTLPFIARYRNEATGVLDEVVLRDRHDRATYLRELEERRAQVLRSIEDQGKLDAALRARIEGAETKQALEDLYLPYRPRRRTRATIARERGLEPLADLIWGGEASDAEVETEAGEYVDAEAGVSSIAEALQGARDILAERISEDADMRGCVRTLTRESGLVVSRAATGKDEEVSTFKVYYDYILPTLDVPDAYIV